MKKFISPSSVFPIEFQYFNYRNEWATEVIGFCHTEEQAKEVVQELNSWVKAFINRWDGENNEEFFKISPFPFGANWKKKHLIPTILDGSFEVGKPIKEMAAKTS